MKKTIIILLCLIAFIVVAVALAGMYKFNYLQDDLYVEDESGKWVKLNDYEKPLKEKLKNGTYMIEGEQVILKDGLSETEAAPGSATKVVTRYVDEYLIADVDQDGTKDIVSFISQETGGSGTFYYIVAQLSSRVGSEVPTALFIGDRITPSQLFLNGTNIVVAYLDRAPGQAMATKPSIETEEEVVIAGGQLKFATAPALHKSWDTDGDGINDCEKDGSCDDSVDYTLPR